MAIAERCRFSLDELRYEYPAELVPAGPDAGDLAAQADRGRPALALPGGRAGEGRATWSSTSCALIAELRYEPFFLTVHDVVRFARGEGILCQGRGSAANSVVCYALRHHRGRPGRG